MRASAFAILAFVSFVPILRAAEPPAPPPPPPLGGTAQKEAIDWNDRRWWQTMKEAPKPVTISLGKSDFVVGGPLVDTFRRPPAAGDENLIQKMRRWPVVNLFVPQPMPWPTRQGKYFAWGQRDVAWSTLADRPIPGPGAGLLNVSW